MQECIAMWGSQSRFLEQGTHSRRSLTITGTRREGPPHTYRLWRSPHEKDHKQVRRLHSDLRSDGPKRNGKSPNGKSSQPRNGGRRQPRGKYLLGERKNRARRLGTPAQQQRAGAHGRGHKDRGRRTKPPMIGGTPQLRKLAAMPCPVPQKDKEKENRGTANSTELTTTEGLKEKLQL